MGLTTKILLAILSLLLVLTISGATFQWLQAAADREKFPPPGRLVEVDGLQMHLDCRGSGKPVVILEAGLGFGSSSWSLVHDAMSEHSEICAYDRPGLDWSEPINRVAGADEVATRLNKLIELGGIEGPYVLLGMSAGGVYVREYFHQYPQDIIGMVLVDSSHEQQGTRLPRFDGMQDGDQILRLCSWLQPLGVVRIVDAMGAIFDQLEIPEDFRALLRANVNQSHTCSSILAESQSFTAELRDTAPPAKLGDLPLTVLSQGNEPEAIEVLGITAEMSRAQRVAWDELQNELTALSARGQRRIARHSGHVIQLDQPQLVVDAVADMVAELRAPEMSGGE